MKKYCISEHRKKSATICWSYLKHFLKSKSRHGVHSPFVYKLIDECIYAKTASNRFSNIEKQRKKLLSDNRKIEVFDFGSYKSAESDYIKRKLAVKTIAKRSLKNSRHTALLSRIADYFNCDNILELGTCFGITTACLFKTRPGSIINTLEGCSNTAGIAKGVFDDLGLKNIKLHVGEIDEILGSVLKDSGTPDLVIIDANHTKKATLKYFNIILNHIDENTVIVIDDIHWSAGMEGAWAVICDNPAVTVTVDLFHMGLVFFRKGLSKENFLIRY